MKHSRTYIAMYDDGHDRGEFEFCSEHRANSKANLEDAKRHYISRYGYTRSKQIEITKTILTYGG